MLPERRTYMRVPKSRQCYHTRAGFRLANDTLLFEHLDDLSLNPAAINAPNSTWRHASDTRLTRNHS